MVDGEDGGGGGGKFSSNSRSCLANVLAGRAPSTPVAQFFRSPVIIYQYVWILLDMKPVVSSGKAYFCTILSIFGIVILSVLGYLFSVGHESMVGSINDPENGKEVAKTIFGAVIVYGVFFVFCGCQVLVIQRQNRIHL